MELGMGEIVLILLVALLVYGGRLPQVAAAVGRSLAELRRGLRETTDVVRAEIEDIADVDPRRAVRRSWAAADARRAQRSLPAESTPRDTAVAEDVPAEAPREDDATTG